MNNYELVIGLEIHVELNTKSKIFCQCEANYFGKEPNTNTCPVCLGLPGALPVPNKKAIESTIKIGQALGCNINLVSKFDRKHYFYADLPKGYQISQYDEPIAIKGAVKIGNKTFRITRVHLEEDTGKLAHSEVGTLVDFNRSGVPLVEIVTEADFNNSDDVKEFLEELRTIIRYLGVSDADMDKGSMRLEPNISLRVKREGEREKKLPNYKVEVKNINSFKFVKKAIEYELIRQKEILEKGETPVQETRGFNENKGITFSQRVKEEAHDYRYFPEPDIPPMIFEQKYVDKLKSEMPELPQEKVARYVQDLKIKEQDAFILTRDLRVAQYFENILKIKNSELSNQAIANLIINKKVATDISPQEFIKIVQAQSTIKPQDEAGLARVIDNAITSNPKAVEEYKSGKENVLMFLVGQVMKEMKGQADPQTIKNKIQEELK